MNKRLLLFTALIIMLATANSSLYGAMSKRDMAQKEIEMLTIKTDVCSICLEQLNLNKEPESLMIIDPCNHLFHRACIARWIHGPDNRHDNQHYICPNCRCDFNSGLPIVTALSTNNPARIHFLLNAGANINHDYKYLGTPLYRAAVNGDLEVFKMLLENGAHININNLYLLGVAVDSGNSEIVKILLAAGANVNPKGHEPYLCQAARRGFPELVQMFLDRGANIEVKDEYGYRALHLAVCDGHIDVVKVLLKAGANVNAVTDNDFGSTALYLTTYHHYRPAGIRDELVQLLKEYGGSMTNYSTQTLRTVLHI